jgi:hypothetical protein
MSDPDVWAAPRTREHTFSTGRTATLRRDLPMRDLVRRGVWDDELAAALALALDNALEDEALAVRLWDAVVMGMFVDPQIVPDDQVDAAARRFPISVLADAEMDETVAAAFGGPASAASFPDVGADEPGAGGGDDVADATVTTGGARAGKRRSAGARRPRGSGAAAQGADGGRGTSAA